MFQMRAAQNQWSWENNRRGAGKVTHRALAFPLQHRALIALLGPCREALNQVHLARDDQNVT